MTRQAWLAPSNERIVGPVDLDEQRSRFTSYHSHRSIAAKADLRPEDPIPLFLSGPAEDRQLPGTGDGKLPRWRTLKAAMLALLGVAIVFAILSWQNRLALFATAKALLPGLSASRSDAAPAKPAVQSTARVQGLPVNTTGTPTRDEIAAAFRAAHQSRTEARQAAAPPPARRMDAGELAALLKRAKSLIEIGDIAPARLLLERAADSQDASAALLLAQTYDPAVLGKADTRSIIADPVTARGWYQKAARLGSADAQQRLSQMQN
jgi:TPR repeat protein